MKKHLSCTKLETALLDDINLTCRSASSRTRTFRSNRLPTANLVDPHQSSIGIKASFVNNLAERAPVPVSDTQKMIGTMDASKKKILTSVWFLTNPSVGSRHGRIETMVRPATAANQGKWFLARPLTGSRRQAPTVSAKHLGLIIWDLIAHHVKSCPRQFVGQCFSGNGRVGRRGLAVIKTSGFGVVPQGRISRLHIRPG